MPFSQNTCKRLLFKNELIVEVPHFSIYFLIGFHLSHPATERKIVADGVNGKLQLLYTTRLDLFKLIPYRMVSEHGRCAGATSDKTIILRNQFCSTKQLKRDNGLFFFTDRKEYIGKEIGTMKTTADIADAGTFNLNYTDFGIYHEKEQGN